MIIVGTGFLLQLNLLNTFQSYLHFSKVSRHDCVNIFSHTY